jgi:hypothetical protein
MRNGDLEEPVVPFHCLAVQRPDREHLADVDGCVAIEGSANMPHPYFTVETVLIDDVPKCP